MTKRILVIEDEPQMLLGLRDNLELEGYEVVTASDGEEGLAKAISTAPDLVILDVTLPRKNGFEVCRELRARANPTPVVMLTARSQETEKVLGLELGADDYVTKPFSVRELLARVRALLRRASGKDKPEKLPDELRFDDVIVDFRSFEASKRGSAVDLTRKEFGVLRLLAANAGQVVTRDDLLNGVWGYDSFPNTRTVDVHIALLRSKLEDNPASPRRLITVHGIGYKLVIS